jgi:ketosteroid isomerase-like protein
VDEDRCGSCDTCRRLLAIASGVNVGSPVANLVTVRQGKVVEIVHYPNADDALADAGA